jgi:transposase
MCTRKQVTVCVGLLGGGGEVEELVAEFSRMASQLLALRDWLKQLGVTHVAMEASGVYWKAPY